MTAFIQRYWIPALAVVCLLFGIMNSWILAALGVALAALSGYPVLSVAMALLLDILYGAPPVRFHFLLLPFTEFAFLLAIVRALVMKNVRKTGLPRL